MTVSIHTRVAIAMANALTAEANVGSAVAAPYFIVYEGTEPATVETALPGGAVALVTMPMSADAFANAADNATDGVAESIANAVADVPAAATGVASFYRLFDRDNVAVWQGKVTEPNLDGDMWLSPINVTTGVNVVVQSFAMRVPK